MPCSSPEIPNARPMLPAWSDRLWNGILARIRFESLWSLHLLDEATVNGDCRMDLAIGIPGESSLTIPGGPGGLTSTDSRLLQQGCAGLSGADELDDGFGIILTVLPGGEGPLFKDGFEEGDTGAWSTASP